MLVVPASLAGEVVGNAPIVFIAAIYGVEKAGLFAMASRLLTAPVSMVAGAVGEAYRVKASTAFHEKKDCREEIMSHSRFVTITALVVSLPIAIFGEELFSIIFGTSWAEAGVIARVLSILVFFQMLSLPFSQTVFVVGKPSLDAFWNLSRLFSLLIGMYAVVFFKLSFEVFLVFVVVHGCLFYSANMIMQWKVAKHTH